VVKRADLLEQNNTVYLVMERLQGNSLRSLLTEPKSAQWILGWLKPLFDLLKILISVQWDAVFFKIQTQKPC
jgi:hypothetical protein